MDTSNEKQIPVREGNDPTEKVIQNYLHKKGYRQVDEQQQRIHTETDKSGTEPIEQAIFDIVSGQDVQMTNYILGDNTISALSNMKQSTTQSSCDAQYKILKKWIKNSLDIYKTELMKLLFPIFVHCYLELASKDYKEAKSFFSQHSDDLLEEHSDDLDKLSSISDSVHLKENPLAITFKTNKYSLRLSMYSFELFFTFLNENKLGIIRKIVNQHLHFIIMDGTALTDREDRLKDEGLAGAPGQQYQTMGHHKHINTQPILWGSKPLSKSEEDAMKQFRQFLSDTARLKPEQVVSTLTHVKKAKFEPTTRDSPSKDRIPLPDVSIVQEIQHLKELSKRVNIGRNYLPTACFYTFHNTFDSLNSLAFSYDFDLVAGGFQDSYIQLWDLKSKDGTGLKRIKNSTELSMVDLDTICDLDSIKEPKGESMYRLIGHSGPVYGCSFGRDQRFLFSSSQDSTVRLWSLDTLSNLVVYKGHFGPVWDVKVGPMGLYFCSGGADRTARLWSTEHISPLRMFVGHLSDVECVEFHPNSNYVGTGSADKTVRLWDIQQGHCVRLFNGGHRSAVTAISISPDGLYLASGDVEGDVCVWDLGNGKRIASYEGYQKKQITSLAFNPDANVLASGSLDGSICVWDVKYQQQVDTGDNTIPISRFFTKKTLVYAVHFTLRNLLLSAGPFLPIQSPS